MIFRNFITYSPNGGKNSITIREFVVLTNQCIDMHEMHMVSFMCTIYHRDVMILGFCPVGYNLSIVVSKIVEMS